MNGVESTNAQFFNLKTPKLSQGRIDNHVAQANLLKVTVKVYASGGENAMHMHPYEDHAFIVLEGEATFHIESDENVRICSKHDGVMLPRGTKYWFQSSGKENLVMLRMGAAEKRPENYRAFPNGAPFVGNKQANKDTLPVVVVPGEYFFASQQ